jgi:hypothetical protein
MCFVMTSEEITTKKMATCWGALNVIIKAEKFGHVCSSTANENLVLVASWP